MRDTIMMNNRRNFLKQAGAFAALTAISPSILLASQNDQENIIKNILRSLHDQLLFFAFEDNDATTRTAITSLVDNYFNEHPRVYDYCVICNEENNVDLDKNIVVETSIKLNSYSEFIYTPIRIVRT